MGNSNSAPTPAYSKMGLVLGQAMQYKNYTKKCDPKLVEKVKSCNLKGKRYLVTGASSGLGKYLCQILLSQGASLVMVSRSLQRLENAKKEITEIVNKQNNTQNQEFDIKCKTLDLANLDTIKPFCLELQQENIEIDALINNGGALPVTQELKQWKNGQVEETIACHVIAPYLLNKYSLPLLEKRKGLIVNNTSAGAYSQKLETYFLENNFNDFVYRPKKNEQPNVTKKYKDGAMVYAQCKRAMLEMTTEFVKKLDEQKSQVNIISMHPGWAKTPGLETLYEQQPQYKNYNFRDADQAAYGMAYPICFPNELQKGKFYFDGEIQDEHKSLAGTKVNQTERDRLMAYLNTFDI